MAYLKEQLVPWYISWNCQNLCSKWAMRALTQVRRWQRHWLTVASTIDWLSCAHLSVRPPRRVLSSSRSVYPGVVNILQHNPDAVVDRVKVRRIRWPQCWRNKVRRISLQESDGVASSMTTPSTRSIDPVRSIFAKKLSKPRLVQFFGRRFCKKMNITVTIQFS